MNLMRGITLGGIVFSLFLTSSVEAQAQGVPSQVSKLQARVDRAIAILGQLETSMGRVSQLEAALAAEKAARQAADTALQAAISAMSGGVSQAALDAAIAAEAIAREAADTAEAAARSTADAALEGQIANEAAGRQALAGTVAALGDSVAPLASLAPLAPLATYVKVETATINGLAGPHVIFSGANVHIQSGHASGDSFTANGRGNLIVGFNEQPFGVADERAGSHNVVIGASHRYNFATGFVAGYFNRLGGLSASVTGGGGNEAVDFASVTGGSNNKASGMYSAVAAGDSNIAKGGNSAVSGGAGNQANGDLSTVSGGLTRITSETFSVVP
jgi:hypothetical protein